MEKFKNGAQGLAFLSFLLILLNTLHSYGATLPSGFQETRIATGLDPTYMSFAPDGRLFITQKNGIISIVKNGALLPTPFLDISAKVDNNNERGLQSLAFDPNFSSNGYIYFYYFVKGQAHNRLSRVTASGDVATNEITLIDFPTVSLDFHNGGGLVFRDGKLYVSTGDGGDPLNAQSFSSILGKVLRVNPDGSIPTDNPFYNTTQGMSRAIYTMGYRNPWRLAIQPGTNRIFLNEVGGNDWEEVNEVLPGKNYGWPRVEGPKNPGTTGPGDYKDPVYTYKHNVTNGCAIAGNTFYNPAVVNFPSKYVGKYFFGDYCAGYIKVLEPNTGEIIETFATSARRPVSLTVAPDGSLYYLSRGEGGNTRAPDGSLFKVRYTGSNAPTISTQPSDVTVSIGGSATFEVAASGATPLSYQWQRNGVNISGATSSTYTMASVALTDNGATFRAVVTNGLGAVTSNSATLNVINNTAPTATIVTPSEGTKYSAGQTLSFSGSGTDMEDGDLPASAFTWEVVFHHDEHTHPALPPTSGSKSGSYVIPTVGETASNVWYRIYLTVKDSKGQLTTTFRDVFPNKVTVTINTVPAGLKLELDGADIATPTTFTGVVGIVRTLGAASGQVLNGVTYDFQSWSDGGAETHTISTPSSNTTYTATFVQSASTVLEAETATLSGAAIGSENIGFTGTGYADYSAATGGYIEWTYNASVAGTYKLGFRYANGSAAGRALELKVNGSVVGQNLPFTPTGSWANYEVQAATANLNAGSNTIRLTTTGANGANVDHLRITPPTTTTEQVATPIFTPLPGTYSNAQSVTLTTTTSGADIYYTTDGSTPTTGSTKYAGAINVGSTKTIKAVAVKAGLTNSAVATGVYTINVGSFDQTYEAETATRVGVIVNNGNPGFTGTGYGDYVNASGEYIEWTVTPPSVGTYNLTFKYALPTGDRPLELMVNGVKNGTNLSFPATGAWTTWQTVSRSVTLTASANKIRLTSVGQSGGNIDHLRVTSTASARLTPERIASDGITMYPMPAKNVLNIKADRNISFVNMINTKGVVMKPSYVAKGDSEIEVNVSGLSEGLYIINLKSGRKNLTRKVMISK